jgi:RNA polymerase sigma factor (sigma-70 family)
MFHDDRSEGGDNAHNSWTHAGPARAATDRTARPASAGADNRTARAWATKLAEGHWNHLVSHARSHLGRYTDDADDVAGEALLMIASGQFNLPRTEKEVVAWTLGVIRHLARHEVRRGARFEPLAENQPDAELSEDWDRAAAVLLSSHVEQALAGLSKGERDVLTRRFLQGQSLAVIADARGSKLRTVKELERRGLNKLRVALRRYDTSGGAI